MFFRKMASHCERLNERGNLLLKTCVTSSVPMESGCIEKCFEVATIIGSRYAVIFAHDSNNATRTEVSVLNHKSKAEVEQIATSAIDFSMTMLFSLSL